MAIEHWVTLVPDTKALEKGIAKALAPVEKPVEVEVTADKGKSERSGRDAGKAVDKGAKASTKDTGKDIGRSVDKGAKEATKDTGKDVGTKIGKDLGKEAETSGKSAGRVLATTIGDSLGSMVKGRVSAVLSKVISGDIKGAAGDVSYALDGISGGLKTIQGITGSDNFIGRGLGRLQGVVDGASSAVGGLADSISSVSSGIGAINDTKDAAVHLVDAFKDAKDGISGVSDMLGALEKRAPAIAAALGKIAGPMIEIAGAAYGVDWVQNHLPESMQGRDPTINKDLGPNQGSGLSGRSWSRDFTHPWEVPQRIFRNFTQDDAGSDGPVARAGAAGSDGPVSDVGGGDGLGDAINSALTGSAPGFNYKPGDSLGDAINDALSGDSRKDVLPDLPDVNEYRIGGGLGDAIRDAQKLDKEAKEARQAADKAQKEADRAEAKDKREADEAAKAAQREADKAQREADRAAKSAQREADKAQRDSARGGSTSLIGGGGIGSSLPGNAGASDAYGLPAGTNINYGEKGFPDWVYQVANAFGLKASTYGGHQESSRGEAGFAPNPQGLNRGIDWSGSPEKMQAFADYLKSVPGMEQVIYQNPATGQRTGVAGGQDVSGSGYYAGDYDGHGDHVHTRQSSAIQLPGSSSRYGGGVDTFSGGGVNPSSMPGFYAWVVPMSGDGAAAAGGPAGGGSSSGGGGLSGFSGGGGSGNSAFDQLRNIGEGGAKETFLPQGFSDPTSWPTVKSGMALLNIFGGMLGKPPGQGMGQQGLIGDTRNLAPGELNPAITAGGSASLLGGAADMMTQLTQGGVAQPGAGNTTIDQSTNFNGNVDGDVSKGMAKANQARTAGAQGLKLTGPRVLS